MSALAACAPSAHLTERIARLDADALLAAEQQAGAWQRDSGAP